MGAYSFSDQPSDQSLGAQDSQPARGTWTHFLYQTHSLSTLTSVLFTVILWVLFYAFNFIIYTFLEGGSPVLTASVSSIAPTTK